jgi:hypothetical protein
VSLRSAAAAIAIAGIALAAAEQARDAARAPLATASIAGRVFVAGSSRQPARRVRVTLNDVTRATPGQTVTTEDDGTFAFRAVPAGRFDLQAFKNGYLRASYGASRPDRAGTPIVVSAGEAVADLALTIVKGGVITGTVRDLRGRALPGLEVRVLRLGYNAVTGEPTLAVPATSVVGATDDRGEYRAYGLPPGGYLVQVMPPLSAGRAGLAELRAVTTEQLRQALAGGPAGSAPAPRVGHVPVFHPGVTDVGAAATIVLGASEERAGADVIVQLVPVATVSGRITSASGELPPLLSVGLVPAGPRATLLSAAGLRTVSAQPQADGTYRIGNVAPGTYTVKAIVGRGRGAPSNVPTLSAAAEVVVTGQDLDVPLTLQPAVPITGRVVFNGSQPAAADLQTLSFALVPLGSSGATLPGGGGRVDAEGRFTFAGVPPDSYRFTGTWSSASANERWAIATAVANGREVLDAPLRVNPGEPVEWTITYTDRPSVLEGALEDRGGRAATEYSVLVFPADRQYWVPGSRRIRMTRPATDGRFRVSGLPAGAYLLVALTDLEPGEWNDPSLLAQIAPAAVAVTVRDGETTTQHLRIGGV